MNDIPHGTTRIKLINSLLAPAHLRLQGTASEKLQAHVQFTREITSSRLDDELSVAVIEFSDPPKWLRHAEPDPFSFPKKTTLGTLWKWVDTAAKDEHGQTEFMRAAYGGNLLYAEMLAEFGDTDINIQDDQGRTALHWVCERNLAEMVSRCLSVPNCIVGLRDKDNLTAFDIALRIKNSTVPLLFYTSILELDDTRPDEALLRMLTVTSEPATDRPVFPGEASFDPIIDRNTPLIRALIARGVDLTARKNGDTALHVAAAQAVNSEVVAWLLEAGSDIDARCYPVALRCPYRRRGHSGAAFALEGQCVGQGHG